MAEKTHSKQFNHLKERYEQGRIRLSILRGYVQTGAITAEEFKEITGETY